MLMNLALPSVPSVCKAQSIGRGQGEVVEVEVTRQNWVVGLSVAAFENPEWRVTALIREGELVFPDIDTDIR